MIHDGLPEEKQIRDYFEKICREENIYTFHKILICFFLERYKRDSNKSSLIDILQKSINYYEFGNGKKWEKLKNIFQTIRKLSFVFLDLQYALCPFNVDLSNVHSNISGYLEELFKAEYESPIIGTLESLDDLLSKNVYLSAESNREFAWHSKEIENKIEHDKKQLITTNELYNYLKNTNFKPKDIKWGGSPNLHILFDVNRNNQLFDLLKRESLELEKKWSKKNGSYLLTFQRGPGSHKKYLALTLSFRPRCWAKKNVKIIGEFFEEIIKLYVNTKKEEEKRYNESYVADTFQEPYQKLVFSELKYITNVKYFFRIKNSDGDRRFILLAEGVEDAIQKVKNEIKNFDDSSSRYDELKKLCHSLQDLCDRSVLNNNSKMLLSLPQILISDSADNDQSDIDGFCLSFTGGDFAVVLVEAKNKKRRSTREAKEQLSKLINQLKFRTSEIPEIKEIKGKGVYGKGVCYCYLKIDGKFKQGKVFSSRSTQTKK